MNTIDQRILIPTDPIIVWDYLSNLAHSHEWQKDVKSVAFLSDRNAGQGTRVRYGSGRGRDQVLDIVAWYNGLGYEYIIVDGTPYKENRGRIRLQEIPEGTVVQWTFTYESGGIRGGRGGKAIEGAMAESLRALYKQVTNVSKSMSHEAKSLMRNAPDVNARSQYRPRHPSAAKPETTPSEPMSAAPLRMGSVSAFEEMDPRAQESPFAPPMDYRTALPAEPPVDDGDTRPNPAVRAVTTTSRVYDYTEEPDFLREMNPSAAQTWDEQPHEDEDAQLITLPRFDFDDLDAPTFTPPETLAAELELLETVWATVPSTALPETPSARSDDSATVAPITNSMDDLPWHERQVAPIPVMPPRTPDPTPPVSTEGIKSIWEVFNVARPSDSQVMRAVEAQKEQEHAAEEAAREIIVSSETTSEPEIERLRPSQMETMPLDVVVEPETVSEQTADNSQVDGIESKTLPIVLQSEPALMERGNESAWLPRTGYRVKLRRQIVRLRHPMS